MRLSREDIAEWTFAKAPAGPVTAYIEGGWRTLTVVGLKASIPVHTAASTSPVGGSVLVTTSQRIRLSVNDVERWTGWIYVVA